MVQSLMFRVFVLSVSDLGFGVLGLFRAWGSEFRV